MLIICLFCKKCCQEGKVIRTFLFVWLIVWFQLSHCVFWLGGFETWPSLQPLHLVSGCPVHIFCVCHDKQDQHLGCWEGLCFSGIIQHPEVSTEHASYGHQQHSRSKSRVVNRRPWVQTLLENDHWGNVAASGRDLQFLCVKCCASETIPVVLDRCSLHHSDFLWVGKWKFGYPSTCAVDLRRD